VEPVLFQALREVVVRVFLIQFQVLRLAMPVVVAAVLVQDLAPGLADQVVVDQVLVAEAVQPARLILAVVVAAHIIWLVRAVQAAQAL
jgi:hypothetical protein